MAAPRRLSSRTPAQRAARKAPNAKPQGKSEIKLPPAEPKEREAKPPERPVHAGLSAPRLWEENAYHPRFGNDWLSRINLIYNDFHNRQSGKNALRAWKAQMRFNQAERNVAKVQRQRGDPQPETGDVPDVEERRLESAAGVVEGRYFAYNNPFANHYATVVAQMQKGASDTYSA